MGQAKLRGSYEERKAQAILNSKQKNSTVLYRYFKTPEQADQFAQGNFWISTLAKCRNYEDPQQGDIYEATTVYEHIPMVIQNKILTQYEYDCLLHAGIRIGNPGDYITGPITCTGNKAIRQINDAFLLCTTYDPKKLESQSSEWKYGVKILLNPEILHQTISKKFTESGLIFEDHKHGMVDYDTSRYYCDPYNPPSNIAFIKPSHQSEQCEYRFFWKISNFHNYGKGKMINCPELSKYFEKLY